MKFAELETISQNDNPPGAAAGVAAVVCVVAPAAGMSPGVLTLG